jgi:hypothetical protein
MNSKRLTQVSFLWLSLAFVSQTLEGGISLIWLMILSTLSLFHFKIISQSKYRFSYLLGATFILGLSWLMSPKAEGMPFFWNEFWWLQVASAVFSVLFLIFKRNQNSVFWHAAMSAIALFFSFYLWKSSFAYAQIALAFVGFLYLASPKVPNRPTSKYTWILWICLGLSSFVTVQVWKSLYPSYKNWAYQRFTNANQAEKGFQSQMKIGTSTGAWDESRDNEILIRLWAKTAPNYLKGMTYSIYKRGEWFATRHKEILFPQQTFVEHSVFSIETLDLESTFQPQIQIQTTSELSNHTFIPLNWSRVAFLQDSIRYNSLDFFTRFESDTKPYFVNTSKSPIANAPKLKESQVPKHLNVPLFEFIQKHKLHLSTNLPQDLQNVFQIHFSYTLTPPNPKEKEQDFITFFLNKTQQGYCEYFASASVMVLRMQGIPARLVKGFAYPQKAPGDDQWMFRRKSAHAWVEYWQNDKWHTYDPTPESALTPQKPLSSFRVLLESFQFKLIQFQNFLLYGEWKIGLESFKVWLELNYIGLIASIIGVLTLYFLIRFAKNYRKKSKWEVIISSLEKDLKKLGFEREKHQSFEEFGSLIEWESISDKKRESLKATLRSYLDNRYRK